METARKISPSRKGGRTKRPGPNRALGQRLRAARLAADYDAPADLAAHLRVDVNSVYRWERGDVEPSLATIREWALACRCSVDRLLGIDGALEGGK